MPGHPSSQRLELFMTGGLAPGESPAIIRHLVAGCSECAKTTSHLWEVLVTGRKAHRPAPEEYEGAFDRAWVRAQEVHELLRLERETAKTLSQELLELPPRRQRLRVRNDRRYQTLPLCQALIEGSKSAIFDDAATASHLADMAREIADDLDTHRYGEAIVADARADAWATYANAVRETSDFEQAEDALRTARAHLEEGTGNPEEKAKYLNSLANVLIERGRIEDSFVALRKLEAIYSKLGDLHMLGRAQLKKAFALHKQGHFEQEIPILNRALKLLDPVRDPRRQVVALHNLVVVLIASGRLEEADRHMIKLRRTHAEQGDRLNLLRLRWLEGELAYAKDDLDLAERLFAEVRNAFIELEIGIDVALVSLDLAEVLWHQGRGQDTQARLQEAIPILGALGVHAEAIAAMAFLEHAVRVETVSRELIRQTAAFVRRVQSDPTARFSATELTGR
ncbi:MAG: hypothetical protein IH936_13890 [Acidobacteria bacterium]|nr:hypothetical protein [Acidobacteriota bacterium]